MGPCLDKPMLAQGGGGGTRLAQGLKAGQSKGLAEHILVGLPPECKARSCQCPQIEACPLPPPAQNPVPRPEPGSTVAAMGPFAGKRKAIASNPWIEVWQRLE